jgi:hypothetical protein
LAVYDDGEQAVDGKPGEEAGTGEGEARDGEGAPPDELIGGGD